MSGFLTFLTTGLALVVGLLAIAAMIGRQLVREVPAGSRGGLLVSRASLSAVPLTAVFVVLIALRVVSMS